MKFTQSRTARILGTFAMALAAIAVLVALSEVYVRLRVPVSLNDHQVLVDSWEKGYVGLKGTWVKEGDGPATPLQLSNITCNANEKKCVESRALISDAHQLSVEQHSYEIVRWDAHSLVYSGSAQCVENTYTVDRDSGQASGIIQLKKGMDAQCPGYPNELKVRLANSAEVYRQAQKEFRPVALNIIGLIIVLLWTASRIQKIKGPRPDTLAR